MNEKLQKKAEKLVFGFIKNANEMGETDLRSTIIKCAIGIVQTEEARQDDDELQSAKEEVKELNAPYKETIEVCKVKIAICREVLKKLGKEE